MPFTENSRRPARSWAHLALAACLLAALVVLLAPGAADSAPARVLVLGQTAEAPPPSCPGKVVNGEAIIPCRIEGHVTGFQEAADGVAQLYEAPFEGKIVAWSITLSKPSSKATSTRTDEVGVFNSLLGQPSEARIGVLRPVGGTKPPRYKLVRQSPIEILNPYFGTAPIFALDQPLVVLKGQIVALTVPTWAPMFAVELSNDNTWRGSRQPGHCGTENDPKQAKEDIQNGHPQQVTGKIRPYGCRYSRARFLYTATLVKKP
jgi:hypothetical protein